MGKKYCKESFNLLDLDHPFRLICINISNSKKFDAFIILLIVINAILLASADLSHRWASKGEASTHWANILSDQTEMMFLGIFTFEMFVKMLAYGVCTKKNC